MKTEVKKNVESEIWMNSAFDSQSVLKVRELIIKDSKDDPEKPIIIYINSYGGSVDALNSLIDTVDSIPNEVITVATGTAMSAGAVLLSSGDKRYITKNSRVMIHKVSTFTWGNADDIKNEAEETARINAQLMAMLAKNCKKTLKQLNDLLKDKRELYLTAEQSVKFGIADEIGFPRLVESKKYEVVL